MDHNVHGTHSLNRYNFLFVPAMYRFGGQRIHLGPIELGPKAANISWNPWKYADHPRTICDIVSFVKVRSMCPGFRFQNSWNSSCERVSSVPLQVASVPISGFPRYNSGMRAENNMRNSHDGVVWLSRHVTIKNIVFLIFFSFKILVRYRSSA